MTTLSPLRAALLVRWCDLRYSLKKGAQRLYSANKTGDWWKPAYSMRETTVSYWSAT